MADTTKYALYMPDYGVFGDARRLATLAQEAETAGWDGFFLWDHIAYYDETQHTLNMVDPWVALTAIAMNTRTIRIGTTVTPLPRRRPWKLARETVSIDRLSGGRLILGVGIGLGAGEWDHLGEETDPRTRGQMLDEGLAVLTGLWSGKPFTYDGQHYQIKDAQFLPTPAQFPRIPIWVGGFWPNKPPFRRMARWDGMFPLFQVYGPEQDALLKEAVTLVKRERQAAGIDAPMEVIKIGVTPGNDREEASLRVRGAVEAGATWWLEVLLPEIYAVAPDDETAFAVMRERVLQGPPRS